MRRINVSTKATRKLLSCAAAGALIAASASAGASASSGDPTLLTCSVNGEANFNRSGPVLGTRKGLVAFNYVGCFPLLSPAESSDLATWTAAPQPATITTLALPTVLSIDATLNITWIRKGTPPATSTGTSHLHLDITLSGATPGVELEHRIVTGPMAGKGFHVFVPLGAVKTELVEGKLTRLTLENASTTLGPPPF
ncbi:hypothetical protein C9F11_46160 (plasmid) [Streptomyces sp. YIM 121038]|uniref:hypothetical protein n=1 Tax=Streptomyces sp. YIM 121038 TaxID=2136401 RepID=UPI001110280F|nr:hypothetical protein [Streptomyces sp. YIM 121038]QCX82782.1 hypothetical protein C9F11_46160 [Streptomyces sp. YIM 121038]